MNYLSENTEILVSIAFDMNLCSIEDRLYGVGQFEIFLSEFDILVLELGQLRFKLLDHFRMRMFLLDEILEIVFHLSDLLV